jgi:hypothetical protein
MAGRHRIDVIEWVNAPQAASHQQASGRFWPPAMIGIVGTLLIHASVIQSLYLGSRALKVPRPEIQERHLSSRRTATNPTEALVFVGLSATATRHNLDDEALAAIQTAVRSYPIVMSRSEPTPQLDLGLLIIDEETEAKATVGEGDGIDRARLLGIYSGQIQARIERAWSRPRTPVNDGSDPVHAHDSVEYFHCQVQVVQDIFGNVQEILLPHCNGTPAWQRSLVMAIQQASPLPAPPDPKVFSRAVSLNLVGYPYVAGGSEDGYETPRVEVAQAVALTRSLLPMAPASSPSRPMDDPPAQ